MPDDKVYYVGEVNRAGKFATYKLYLVEQKVANILQELDSHMSSISFNYMQGKVEKLVQESSKDSFYFVKKSETRQKPVDSSAPFAKRMEQRAQAYDSIKAMKQPFLEEKDRLLKEDAAGKIYTGMAGALILHQILSQNGLKRLLEKKIDNGGLQKGSILKQVH